MKFSSSTFFSLPYTQSICFNATMFLLFITSDSTSKVATSCINTVTKSEADTTSTMLDNNHSRRTKRISPILLHNSKLRDERTLLQVASIIADEQDYIRKSRRLAMEALTVQDWDIFHQQHWQHQEHSHGTSTTCETSSSDNRHHKAKRHRN